MDNATQVGSLIVRARTGYGLYPLENAHVTVTLEDREDSKVVADVYTDNSGNTPIIKVAVEGNNRKGEYYPTGQDFTVEVAKDGYQTVILYGVKLYPGVETSQTVLMAPLPDNQGIKPQPYDIEIMI